MLHWRDVATFVHWYSNYLRGLGCMFCTRRLNLMPFIIQLTVSHLKHLVRNYSISVTDWLPMLEKGSSCSYVILHFSYA